jgi:hypothetical protein
MKLQLAVILAALMLLAGIVQAETKTAPLSLTKALVQKVIPLVKAELAGASALDSKLAAVGMTKSDYTTYKNTLIIAKLDLADAGRLTRNTLLVSVRKANIEILKELTAGGVNIDIGPVGSGTLDSSSCGVLCGRF